MTLGWEVSGCLGSLDVNAAKLPAGGHIVPRCLSATTLLRLTCTDHPNIFAGLEVLADQMLYWGAVGDCLGSLRTSWDHQQVKPILLFEVSALFIPFHPSDVREYVLAARNTYQGGY